MVPAVAAATGLTVTPAFAVADGAFDAAVAEIDPVLKAKKAAAPAGITADPVALSALLATCLPAELRHCVRAEVRVGFDLDGRI